jgi:hypothetical protein
MNTAIAAAKAAYEAATIAAEDAFVASQAADDARVNALGAYNAARAARDVLTVVAVPARFWDDHADRCPHDDEDDMPRVIERRGNRVFIKANPAGLAGLASDAAYYAGDDFPDLTPRYVRDSAKRTVAALAAAMPTKEQTA